MNAATLAGVARDQVMTICGRWVDQPGVAGNNAKFAEFGTQPNLVIFALAIFCR